MTMWIRALRRALESVWPVERACADYPVVFRSFARALAAALAERRATPAATAVARERTDPCA